MNNKSPSSPGLNNEKTKQPTSVLSLLAKGLDNRAIADCLNVTEMTVRTHISHILDKLHLANRVQATLYALRTGLRACWSKALRNMTDRFELAFSTFVGTNTTKLSSE